MTSPEIIIISINLALVLAAYVVLYPKYAGDSINRLSVYDLAISLFSLLISASLFWDKGISFSLGLFDTNWFWFSILTYLVIELPFFIGYIRVKKLKF